MAFHHPLQVFGFHSCDREVGLAILNGEMDLNASNNAWDWLGGGIYFWEQNPGRALSYAEECAEKKQYFAGEIKTPFVLGAIINLGNCLNLLEAESAPVLESAHDGLVQTTAKAELKMPVNKNANRALDCAVIQYLHQSNIDNAIPAYDTIRSSFDEGEKVYAGSVFTKRLHIEVCVINPAMILGYYLPRPIKRYNPYLRAIHKV
ncbi:MAG: hypothetical protein EOP53_06170 [Sphingobacteriales bacterium]|nr:MAG: hypothetical protein EOP53_06170 [Sphingobacteriales bacterium]